MRHWPRNPRLACTRGHSLGPGPRGLRGIRQKANVKPASNQLFPFLKISSPGQIHRLSSYLSTTWPGNSEAINTWKRRSSILVDTNHVANSCGRYRAEAEAHLRLVISIRRLYYIGVYVSVSQRRWTTATTRKPFNWQTNC